MTPRLVHALCKRQLEQLRREEVLVGILAATTANFSFSPPKKSLRPEDFMLHPMPKQEELSREPEPSGDGIMAQLERLPAGTVKKESE